MLQTQEELRVVPGPCPGCGAERELHELGYEDPDSRRELYGCFRFDALFVRSKPNGAAAGYEVKGGSLRKFLRTGKILL